MLVHISYIQELLIFKDVNVKINENFLFLNFLVLKGEKRFHFSKPSIPAL